MPKKITNEQAVYAMAEVLEEVDRTTPALVMRPPFNHFIHQAAARLGGLIPNEDFDVKHVLALRRRDKEIRKEMYSR